MEPARFFSAELKKNKIKQTGWRRQSEHSEVWWSQTESNRRHPACKAGTLPTELWPQAISISAIAVVGLGRLELPTLRLSGVRSNHLSYRPLAKALARSRSSSEALAQRHPCRAYDAQPTYLLPYEAAADCVLGRETKTAAIRNFADQVS